MLNAINAVTIALRRCVVNGKMQKADVFSFHIENRTEIGNFSRFLNDRTWVTQKSIIKYNIEAIGLSFVEVKKDKNNTFAGVKTTSSKRSLSSRFF